MPKPVTSDTNFGHSGRVVDAGRIASFRSPADRPVRSGMRALLVVSEAPPIVSGVSRAVAELTRGLEQRGFVVDTVSSNEIRRWTLGEVRVSAFAAHWRSLSRTFDDYDVVNVHGPVPTMSDAFLTFFRSRPRLARPALVYTHHSSIDLPRLGPLCRLYDDVTARMARVADRTVVTTESYATAMRSKGVPSVEVIPWGVDADRFSADREPRTEGPLRILFLGQLRPYKGISIAVRAVARHRELELTIAGSGPQEGQLRREVAALGATNVRFVGRVPDEDLPGLYRNHEVVVLPSTTRAEAFGLVLLEGMAAGCVPVASDLPGVRDIAGPTGLLVQPDDPEELRNRLISLARDPERRQRLASASAVAARGFSWDRVGNRYAATFWAAAEEVLARRGSAILRAPVHPNLAIEAFARRFNATWWSFMLFHGESVRPAPVAWGRAGHMKFHLSRSPVAEYVAHERRPVLLDGDSTPSDLRSLMTRDDVSSAIAVPVGNSTRTVGVLSLSIGRDHIGRYTNRDLADLAALVA